MERNDMVAFKFVLREDFVAYLADELIS